MYEITIKKIETVTKKAGKDWDVISRTSEPGKVGEDRTYGYTPEIDKEVEVNRVIYNQTVDDLELIDVIAAVNGVQGWRPPGVLDGLALKGE